jgi:Ras-related GTP-binding protein C/D
MLTMFGPLYRLVAAYSLVILLKTFYRSASATPTRSHRPTDIDLLSSTSTTSTGADVTGPSVGRSRPSSVKRHKDVFYPSAATSLHPSTPGNTLTYHLITSRLALLAVLPTNVYESRRGLIEYNVVFFREGIQEICDTDTGSRAGG